MSWEDIDNKLKKATDKLYVSCDEDYELDYVRKILKGHYGSSVTEKQIDDAMKHCCNTIKAPRKREDYSKCIHRQLG